MAASLPPELQQLDPFTTRHAKPGELAVITKSAKDGRPRYVISSDQPDLVGDIIVQEGMRPVSARIPAQVDHSGQMHDVVGWWDDIERAVVGKITKTLATLHLFEPGITRTADMVRAMHEAGMRMAASVGFVPDYEEGGYELLHDAKNDHVTGIKWLRCTLIEASVVVVPANPGALSVRSYDLAKRLGMDAKRFDSFVMTGASQRLLQGMRGHDARARVAAAMQKAQALLERG